MILGEPARTQADINFPLLGVQVRVSPFFWLMALVIGYRSAEAWAKELELSQPQLIVVFMIAAFISVLIHEMGHALAYRRYGLGSHIVLYHFGGLAIADSAYPGVSTGRSLDSRAKIFVSAAGPAAQLIAAACVIAILKAGSFSVPLHLPSIGHIHFLATGDPLPSVALIYFIDSFLWFSIFLALLNLLPLYPLDGGQIARELFVMKDPRSGIINSLKLSIVTGVALAVYGLTQGSMLMMLMCGMLAFSSYQTLQQYTGRGGGGMNPWQRW